MRERDDIPNFEEKHHSPDMIDIHYSAKGGHLQRSRFWKNQELLNKKFPEHFYMRYLPELQVEEVDN